MQCLMELMVVVDEVEVADEGVGAGPRRHARRAAGLEVGVDERGQQKADAQRQPHPGDASRLNFYQLSGSETKQLHVPT